MKVRAVITGATGMVGEGVLLECLSNPDVEQVLVLNRKPCGVSHAKLTEVLCPNFMDLSAIESKLQNYNACFFCMGVSSIGMTEAQYTSLNYDIPLNVAKVLSRLNNDMVFCFVSGAGTNGNEQSKSMWVRVKSRAENDLMKLPFKKAYMFRPGYMQPTKGAKNTIKMYNYVKWMYPLLRVAFPKAACSLQEVGIAMIHTVTKGYEKNCLEVKDIVELAKH
jgi:nucleoside-diphosphate-sugar epimerase